VPGALPSVNVLVTDLDNTVWDWFTMWHAGFSAFLEQLVSISGVDQAILEGEIRVHHQANFTSEYSPTFLIPQLPSLQEAGLGRDDLLAKYQDATHAWHSGRKYTTRLYPGVLDTLVAARKEGTIVVGYTESQAFVTAQRILRTGLDGVIDYLYSPEDHEIPEGVSIEEERQYDNSAYELALTRHFHTPPEAKKPSPEVLKTILADANASPSSTVYVGDSRMKDIAMAQSVGAVDVWAKYGEVQHLPEYDLLRRVSHWTDEDVQREQRIAKTKNIAPSHVLENGFDELQQMFTFSRRRPLTSEEVQNSLVAWKQTIEVQEHFNDLEMRIRNFGLTLLVAVLGVTGAVLKDGNKLLSIGLVTGALIAWASFYVMDRWWYHPLLRGAVSHATALEDTLTPQVPGIGLSRAITHASHTEIRVIRKKERQSTTKLKAFYVGIGLVLALLLGALVLTDVGEGSSTVPSNSPTHTVSPQDQGS
jgi:FMN phosphatase YigB (HAD superfamily)